MATDSEECAEAAFVTGGNCGFMSAENYFCILFAYRRPRENVSEADRFVWSVL